MNYYLDTEFIEGPQDKRFLGIKYGTTKNTIDLISIGIVSEDNREYYAISKDFNLKEAWNRFQIKEYWIRENVLRPIHKELFDRANDSSRRILGYDSYDYDFSFKQLKKLIKNYGKTNEQIAKEIKNFIYLENKDFGGQVVNGTGFIPNKYPSPKFYAYYADYDWVVFCWLFGRMIDLPKGFPKFCNDLKQISDDVYNKYKKSYEDGGGRNFILKMSNHSHYPKQKNEHNALDDAKWNKILHKFLKTL